MRIVFWGTPQVAVPFLESLLKLEEVVGVVTQTDKPASRGQQIHSSPVKLLAEQRGLPVLQPSKLKDEAFLSQLGALKPEAGIVVAYGRIIPPEAIRLFPQGLYNMHFSLLPHLRGAAPIQWAILRGDRQTGVTSFRIEEGLDNGRMLVQKPIGISESDNAISLEEKLVSLGVVVMEETLGQIKAGGLGRPQEGESTYAPLIQKADARIDWKKPAEEVARQVRGLVRLGAWCKLPDGRHLKILRVEQAQGTVPQAGERVPGALRAIEKGRGFVVECEVGALIVLRLQAEGKKETDAWSFLQGSRLKIGDVLA